MVDEKKLSFLGLICFAVGLGSFAYYPQYSHRTYVSENALLPGSASVGFGETEIAQAIRFTDAAAKAAARDREAEWIAETLSGIGAESYVFGNGTVVWGILRAPRGDGKESIALSARFSGVGSAARGSDASACDGLGMVLSIASFLTKQNWLAKDFVFVLSRTDGGTAAWLDHYIRNEARAGSIQAAINLDLARLPRSRAMPVLLHGANGQLPNLDMLNTIVRIAGGYNIDRLVTLESANEPHSAIAAVEDVLSMWFPRKLASFMVTQAIGLPNGDHAHFNRYRIDSVTVSTDPRPPVSQQYLGVRQGDVGRIVVSMLRSLNNLLEHLHQSFYFYELIGPSRYLSIAEYSISLALLLAPLVAIVLPAVTSPSAPTDGRESPRGALRALVEVAVAHIVCGASYVAGMLAIPSGTTHILWWSGVSVACASLVIDLVLPLLGGAISPSGTDPVWFRVFSVLPCAVALGTLSLLNFSFCALVAIAVVPIAFLLSRPAKSRAVRYVQFGVALAASLPALVLCLYSALGFASPVQFIAALFKQHVEYSTLFFPFFLLIYCPMNLSHIRLLQTSL